ncbi:MAG: TIGR03617 family F420-dependent LLM class oxidoreductase [Pseudonocardia sp.]|jgi:probable F420-dependent oxidoreductase
MEIDFYQNNPPRPSEARAQGAALEESGFAGLWSIEAGSDPLLPLILAADATRRIQLGTAITVALARNPVVLAQAAHDLNVLAEGRFMLGLGSQVKGHIERRYGMPWSRPAARMRDFIGALRAVWSCWNDGTALDYRGEFYQHTLMTPMFSAAPSEFGPPRVILAGVGEIMTRLAGEVADGFAAHPLTVPGLLDEFTLPMLRRGMELSGRDRASFCVMAPVMVVTGADSASMDAALAATRQQIGFYASTPAYRSVLEFVGAADIGPRLTELSRRGDWAQMSELVSDDLVDAFAVVAPPEQLTARLRARFEGRLDRAALYAPYDIDPELWQTVIDADRAAEVTASGR